MRHLELASHAARECGRGVASNAGAMRGQHAASHNFHALLKAKPEQRTKAINELLKAQSGQKPKGVKIDEPKQIVERDERFPRR
jgi:uncharacterized protein YneF (UPF0154 family)